MERGARRGTRCVPWRVKGRGLLVTAGRRPGQNMGNTLVQDMGNTCRELQVLTIYANGVVWAVCILSRRRFLPGRSPLCSTMLITASYRSLWRSNPGRGMSSAAAAGCAKSARPRAAAASEGESGRSTTLCTTQKFTFSSPTRRTNRRISTAGSCVFSVIW